jgi:hypothetical protein
MAEGEKSLDQLTQLAISASYNCDITNREKDKRHDLIAAPTQPSRGCYHGGQEGYFYTEWLRGNNPGDRPAPNQDPTLSTKVTTGGLSAPVSRWKVKCHLLWIDGSQPLSTLHFLALMLRSLMVAIMTRKKNIIFWLDSGAHISVLSFSSGPSPMTRLSCWTNLARL